MNRPRVLVTTAAGRTGLPIALQLLAEGFPVTALVRREDRRSERLRAAGADIVVGSLTDIGDMRRALSGVQRAYFCAPYVEGYLRAASVFAAVATEQRLESVVVMSQWLADPTHPSLHTREAWLADRVLALLPGTDVTTINVGYFADNDLQALPFAAQFGLLMLPYGDGRNAPPSNEDIARVVAEVIARPEGHAGQTYRPTGPRLLSPQDIAATFATVLGRKVTYVDAPIWVFAKVMQGVGIPAYQIAQVEQYLLDYQRGAFTANAPTDVVRQITGREAEDYETITRRYVAAMPDAKPGLGAFLKYSALMTAWMLRPSPKTDPYLGAGDFADGTHIRLSVDSPDWRGSHGAEARPEWASVSPAAPTAAAAVSR